MDLDYSYAYSTEPDSAKLDSYVTLTRGVRAAILCEVADYLIVTDEWPDNEHEITASFADEFGIDQDEALTWLGEPETREHVVLLVKAMLMARDNAIRNLGSLA